MAAHNDKAGRRRLADMSPSPARRHWAHDPCEHCKPDRRVTVSREDLHWVEGRISTCRVGLAGFAVWVRGAEADETHYAHWDVCHDKGLHEHIYVDGQEIADDDLNREPIMSIGSQGDMQKAYRLARDLAVQHARTLCNNEGR